MAESDVDEVMFKDSGDYIETNLITAEDIQ